MHADIYSQNNRENQFNFCPASGSVQSDDKLHGTLFSDCAFLPGKPSCSCVLQKFAKEDSISAVRSGSNWPERFLHSAASMNHRNGVIFAR